MSGGYQSLPPEVRQAVGTAADSMDGEKTVGEVRQMLETTQKGQTANTPGNYRAVFLHDPLLRGAFSSNLLTDRVDIVKQSACRSHDTLKTGKILRGTAAFGTDA